MSIYLICLCVFVLGFAFGLLVMCLCVAASSADTSIERMKRAHKQHLQYFDGGRST